MSYRKVRTQHNEISVRLTYSTHHNPEKKNVYQARSNSIHRLYNINANLSSSHLASSFAEESTEHNRNSEF